MQLHELSKPVFWKKLEQYFKMASANFLPCMLSVKVTLCLKHVESRPENRRRGYKTKVGIFIFISREIFMLSYV